MARSSYDAAAGLLREALRALERLPETPGILAQAIDLRLDLRVALVSLGLYQDVLAVMREAEGLATRLGDRGRLGRGLADICARLRKVAGEHVQAIGIGRRALSIADERGPPRVQRRARGPPRQRHFAHLGFRQAPRLL